MPDEDFEPLFGRDAMLRVDAVCQFVVDHIALQGELDLRPERPLEEWVAIVGASVGRAAALTEEPPGFDQARAAAAWLTCASADSLRARAAQRTRASADARRAMTDDVEDLAVHLLMALELGTRWSLPGHIMLVYRALGALATSSHRLLCADFDRHGERPPPREPTPDVLTRLLRRSAEHEPPDPLERVLGDLRELARQAAAAAVLIHPGGPIGMLAEPR